MASATIFMIRFAAVAILTLAPCAASAAVRQCWPIVSSEIASAPTELDAKKKALEQWRAKAQALGPGLDSWRLAHDKSLKCFPKAPGSFECIAFGAPCVIDQTPKSPPAAKGVGI
jgi:hypothetical protein